MVVFVILSACVLANILITFSLLLDTCPPIIPSDTGRLKEDIKSMHRKLLVLMGIDFILLGVAVYLNDFAIL